MSYLDITNPILDAKLTNVGRQKISEGNFNISYFQIGDSEFDYNFPNYSGGTSKYQKVLSAMDKNLTIKYPYMISPIVSGTTTGTTIGTPILKSETTTIKNDIGCAGLNSGTTINTYHETILLEHNITVTGVTNFNIDDDITLIMGELNGNQITGDMLTYTYKIIYIIDNTLYVDRLIYFTNTLVTIVKNDFNNINSYEITNPTPYGQQDAWNLNVVWGSKPIGFNSSNKSLTVYESNTYVSSKEYFGYATSAGQLTNTGTTITDSSLTSIIVSPEEQHSLAIIHYSKESDNELNLDKIYKYDDYIASDYTNGDVNYFEIHLPFLMYERNTNSTIGAKFYMGTVDKFINSSAVDSWPNSVKYRNLIDEQGFNVGKIFVDDNIIIFDDQEIVAVLDSNTNRNYTLPIPKIDYLPSDVKCSTSGSTINPLLNGNTTGYTYYVTYGLEYSDDNTLYTYYGYGTQYSNYNGRYTLPCNHYLKITGTTQNCDLSIKFSDSDFKFMKQNISDINNGYIANKFYIYYQRVLGDAAPSSENWVQMDFTNEVLPLVGGVINPALLRNRFIITNNDVTGGTHNYTWAGADNFGMSQVLPGSVKLRRAYDIKLMKYYVNLPDGEFTKTQNPTYLNGDKYITEVGLLDENFDMVVSGKLSTPLKRTGSQILSVKLDI